MQLLSAVPIAWQQLPNVGPLGGVQWCAVVWSAQWCGSSRANRCAHPGVLDAKVGYFDPKSAKVAPTPYVKYPRVAALLHATPALALHCARRRRLHLEDVYVRLRLPEFSCGD